MNFEEPATVSDISIPRSTVINREESSVSDIDRECPICLRKFRDPRSLPCSHTFCRECLSCIIEVTSTKKGFGCPRCSVLVEPLRPLEPKSQWAEQFPSDFRVAKDVRLIMEEGKNILKEEEYQRESMRNSTKQENGFIKHQHQHLDIGKEKPRVWRMQWKISLDPNPRSESIKQNTDAKENIDTEPKAKTKKKKRKSHLDIGREPSPIQHVAVREDVQVHAPFQNLGDQKKEVRFKSGRQSHLRESDYDDVKAAMEFGLSQVYDYDHRPAETRSDGSSTKHNQVAPSKTKKGKKSPALRDLDYDDVKAAMEYGSMSQVQHLQKVQNERYLLTKKDNKSTISAATFYNNRIILYDSSVQELAIYDSNFEKLQSLPQERVYDMTVMDELLYLTYPEERAVDVINLEEMKKLRPIELTMRCYGIDSLQDKVSVLLSEDGSHSQISFIRRSLVVGRSISVDLGRKKSFKPRRMSVCRTRKLIYISDEDKGTVKCLTLGGHQKWEKNIFDAGCLAVVNEHLLVSRKFTNSIDVISERGTFCSGLIPENFQVYYPELICPNVYLAQLLVVDWNNVVHIYNIWDEEEETNGGCSSCVLL